MVQPGSSEDGAHVFLVGSAVRFFLALYVGIAALFAGLILAAVQLEGHSPHIVMQMCFDRGPAELVCYDVMSDEHCRFVSYPSGRVWSTLCLGTDGTIE